MGAGPPVSRHGRRNAGPERPWTFYLRDLLYLDPEVGFAENLTNLGYPVGDLVLLVALMILSTRRSEMQFHGRLLLVARRSQVTGRKVHVAGRWADEEDRQP